MIDFSRSATGQSAPRRQGFAHALRTLASIMGPLLLALTTCAPSAFADDGAVFESHATGTTEGGGVYIGETATSVDTLVGDLTKELTLQNEMGPDARVYIRADRSVKYGQFMNVINTLQEGGFYQVALINEEL